MAENEQEKQHNELVDRLKKEGQLTRNSGSNSLKSVKLEIGKFDDALSAMRSKLKEQTVAINDLLGVQKKALELEESEVERQKKKEQLESVEKTVSKDDDDESDKKRKKPTPGGFTNFMRKIGPGLGAFIGAGLAGAAGLFSSMRLGRLVLRAIPVVALAPLIGEFIGDFAKASLTDFLGRNLEEGEELSDARNEFIDSFSSSAGRVGIWAAIGAIFGRRMAAIFGAAGLAAETTSPAIERLLEKTGFSEDGIIEAFGKEWDSEKVSKGIGAAMGAITMAALTNKSLWRRVGIPGLVITAVLAFSEPLKDWLVEQGLSEGLSEEIVNFTGFVATGASLGGMFGWKGALVGAAVGLAIGLGASIVRWMQRMRNRQEESFEEQVAESERIIASALEEGRDFTIEEAEQIGSTMREAERRQQLLIGDEQVERAAAVEQTMSDALAGRVLDPSSGVSEDQLRERVMRSLEGDESALKELLEFAKGREEETSGQLLRFASRERFIRSLLEGLEDLVDDSQGRVEWQRMVSEILKIQGFGTGTKGFQDFGSGSLAMLHGIEAVVPRQTPAGEVLATMFDENFEPRFDVNSDRMSPVLEQISTAAHNVVNNIVFAPTSVAPVTSIQQGGSTVSSVTQNSITSFGSGTGGSGLGRFAN